MASLTGITVMPESYQNEGISGVLDRLAAAGVSMVATSPYVMEPSTEAAGSREPPIDAGAGSVRLLDRPLWGRRELFVRTEPSFRPTAKLYSGLAYQPPPTGLLTERQGAIVGSFLRAARRRGLKTYLQIQAAIPPGYRVQFGGPREADKPRLPDGRIPPRRLANNGSLASAEILNYTLALTRDLLAAYPDIDGIRYDWPEYPPYFLDDVFLDFNPQVQQAAARHGLEFGRIHRETLDLYRLLHGGLSNRHLERWEADDGGRGPLLRALLDRPGLADWLRLKSALVTEFVMRLREAVPPRLHLALGTFPPPFTLASGLNFGALAPYASSFHVKLYTMHWPVILRFYGEQLRRNNPGLDEALLVRVLSNWLGIEDRPYHTELAQFRYPEPEEPHPAGPEAQVLKLRDAQAEAGETPVYAFVHGYGPVADFARRYDLGQRAAPPGVWINRYEYLRDEKLAHVGSRAIRSAP